MGADQVLRGADGLPAAYTSFAAPRQPFEDLSEQWRTMPRRDGIKKIFFMVSLAAFTGYYAFLAFIAFLR